MNLRITVKRLKMPYEEMTSFGRAMDYLDVESYEIIKDCRLLFFNCEDKNKSLFINNFVAVKMIRKNSEVYLPVISKSLLDIQNMYPKQMNDYIYFYLKSDSNPVEISNHVYLSPEQEECLNIQFPELLIKELGENNRVSFKVEL